MSYHIETSPFISIANQLIRRQNCCVDPRKVTAAEEILKHSILDIELTEENLLSCVFIGFITKQNAIKEELKKYLRPSMSILKSMSLTFLHSS